MQKFINAIAILSGVISLTVVGSGVVMYLQKDAIIENVKGKVMDAVMPSIGGGITEFDTWRQTSNFQGNTTPIANNWEREDTHLQGNMGTGMSESSGIFTFPSTGYWWVHFNIQFSSGAADNDYILAQIQHTENNSSYTGCGFAYASIKNNASYQTTYVQKLLDITDTSNQKVRFIATSQDDNHYVQTDTNQNGTYVMFIKMGDT